MEKKNAQQTYNDHFMNNSFILNSQMTKQVHFIQNQPKRLKLYQLSNKNRKFSQFSKNSKLAQNMGQNSNNSLFLAFFLTNRRQNKKQLENCCQEIFIIPAQIFKSQQKSLNLHQLLSNHTYLLTLLMISPFLKGLLALFSACEFKSAHQLINSPILLLMKLLILILVLACAQLATAGTLVLPPTPLFEARYGPQLLTWSPYIDPTKCGYDVDFYVRQKFVYYLGQAQLSYISHINHPDGFLYIHQYRNTFGTFMCLSKYWTKTKSISVVHFNRLGDGYRTRQYLFEPIPIKPFGIYFNLGYGEYLVPQWKNSEVPNWSQSWARRQFYKTPSAADAAEARCLNLDITARKTYWYYLDGAKILSSSNSAFGDHCYCMNTYVNRIGVWQVIGTHGPSGIEINTFVRLGDGYDPASDGLCRPYPSFDSWRI